MTTNVLQVNQIVFYTLSSAASLVLFGLGSLMVWDEVKERFLRWYERREEKNQRDTREGRRIGFSQN
jgi:hypothetical protein